jgi:NAD dependent epimerase/dehydratase family enzyme
VAALVGDFAEELLLSGQRVAPAAAVNGGFRFTYPALDQALAQIVGARPGTRRAEAAAGIAIRARSSA